MEITSKQVRQHYNMLVDSMISVSTLWLVVATQFIEVVYGRRRRPSKSLVAGFADGDGTPRVVTGE